MSEEVESSYRRPRWSYFGFPALVIVLGVAGIVTGTIQEGAFILMFVPLLLWAEWSIVSGLYPWSMRL